MARRAAYNRATNAALADWRAQNVRNLKAVRRALQLYEHEILSGLASETAWDISRRQVVRDMLANATRSLETRLADAYRMEATRASALSLSTTDDALTAMGVNLSHVPALIPERQLAVINSVLPDLIVDVTTQARKGVQQVINQVMLGGMSRDDAIRTIGRHVGSLDAGKLKRGQIIPRAQVRARTILRTELNRVASLTTTKRIEELAAHDPNVGLKWVHFPSREPRSNHQALHGTIIYPAKGEKFNVGGTMVGGPHAVELPAREVINCHCKAVIYYDPADKPLESSPHADPIINRVA